VIIVLVEKQHDVFKRKGNDLIMEYKIPLVQALTGYSFSIKHLDGRTLVVQSTKGDVITPNEIRKIEGEGMPIYKNPMKKGDLYVVMSVEFPKPGFIKSDKQLQQLKAALPEGTVATPAPSMITDDMEIVHLKTVTDKDQPGRTNGRRGEVYDDDESDDSRGGRRVQCAQQ
jgi:DnaJ family protein A protein 2